MSSTACWTRSVRNFKLNLVAEDVPGTIVYTGMKECMGVWRYERLGVLFSPTPVLPHAHTRLLLVLLFFGLSACTTQRPPAAARGASPPPLDVAALRQALHEQINAARRTRGRPPLAYGADLQRLAQVHSRDMATQRYFAHENPAGADVNDRAQQFGLSCTKRLEDGRRARGFGENLFRITRYASYRDTYRKRGNETEHVERTYDWHTASEIAETAVASWLDSPGHRRNLLNPLFEAEGLGIAVTADGLHVYVTQVLC